METYETPLDPPLSPIQPQHCVTINVLLLSCVFKLSAKTSAAARPAGEMPVAR